MVFGTKTNYFGDRKLDLREEARVIEALNQGEQYRQSLLPQAATPGQAATQTPGTTAPNRIC